jgi:hypothetical protein
MDSRGLVLREYLRNVEAAESERREREVAMFAMIIGAHNINHSAQNWREKRGAPNAKSNHVEHGNA